MNSTVGKWIIFMGLLILRAVTIGVWQLHSPSVVTGGVVNE